MKVDVFYFFDTPCVEDEDPANEGQWSNQFIED